MVSATIDYIEKLEPAKKLVVLRNLKIFTYCCFGGSAVAFAFAISVAIYALVHFTFK